MIEIEPLRKINKQYRELLEKYEDIIEIIEIEDIKRLIGEVRLFWYRQQKCINYFISNIEKNDEVAYLAGAVRLDIVNDGQLDFALVGKYRIINDPIVKLASFYLGTSSKINFQYTNQYLKDCIKDLLLLFRQYQDDFYVLPIDPINVSDLNKYYSVLSTAAENMMLALFEYEYASVREIISDCCSYEDVESKLLPEMKERLVYDSLEDSKLSLRDRCLRYLGNNGDIMPVIKELSEPQIFCLITNQYCMQALAIANLMKNYSLCPFIRNDITFQFFSLIFHSNVMSDFSSKEYMQVYIPYVLQKAVDFSDLGYQKIKEKIGGGKMVSYLIKNFETNNIEFPMPKEIVEKAKDYINQH